VRVGDDDDDDGGEDGDDDDSLIACDLIRLEEYVGNHDS